MANDTGESGLSTESLAYLTEAKKGKPRRFVMISKGSHIVSLIVYKKGSLDKFKKEAKEAGKGSFCFGIVEGSGSNMAFKLASADGFSAPPTKNAVLKSYLADADFPCKPEFVLVPTLPDVPDDEPEVTNAKITTVDPPLERQETNEAPASSDADRDEKLKRQLLDILGKIVPLIKQQISQFPEQKDQLLAPLAEIKALIAAGSLDQAKALVQATAKQVMARPNHEAEVAPKGTATPDEADQSIIIEWKKLRGEVVGNLKELAKFAASTKSPEASKAIIELKALIANLSESPAANQVADLIRYLREDDVVADICALAFDFRAPLLQVLQKMQ